MSQAIVLKSLTIRDTNYYSGDAPSYSGELDFRGATGDVKLRLNADLSKKILAVVADSMVESTKELANSLSAEILSGVAALPAPATEESHF